MDGCSQSDTGLSDEDIRDMTTEWNKTMAAVQRTLWNHKARTWSLVCGQENANAMPFSLTNSTSECMAALQEACAMESTWQVHPMIFGFSMNGTNLTQLPQDLALFLLARGPCAWAGWGVWGMTWPFNAEPSHGQLPPMPHGAPLPKEFDDDCGTPEDEVCFETVAGVFHREWSCASIELDCHSFQSTVTFKDDRQETLASRQETVMN
jgi:hypothetical protein